MMVSLGESQFADRTNLARPTLPDSHNVAALLSPRTVRPYAQDEWHLTSTRDRPHGPIRNFALVRPVHHLRVVEIGSADGTKRALHATGLSLDRSHRAGLSHRALDADDTISHHRTASG